MKSFDSTAAPHSGGRPGLAADRILAELGRILESELFRNAEMQRNFLRYGVEQVLADHGEEIKEYTMAREALGKENSFDPRLYASVRIQTGRLRSRPARYYETEGANDPLRI